MFKATVKREGTYGTFCEGLAFVEFTQFKDNRGYFSEIYKGSWFQEQLHKCEPFVQYNESFSHKGTWRGLHFQLEPYMGKLVYCTQGSIYDVVLDMRKNSKTWGKWFAVMLKADEPVLFWVPRGFAHGFLALEDKTKVLYGCDGEHNGKNEYAVDPFDEFINVNFEPTGIKTEDFNISAKDKKGINLGDWLKHSDSEQFVYGRNC